MPSATGANGVAHSVHTSGGGEGHVLRGHGRCLLRKRCADERDAARLQGHGALLARGRGPPRSAASRVHGQRTASHEEVERAAWHSAGGRRAARAARRRTDAAQRHRRGPRRRPRRAHAQEPPSVLAVADRSAGHARARDSARGMPWWPHPSSTHDRREDTSTVLRGDGCRGRGRTSALGVALFCAWRTEREQSPLVARSARTPRRRRPSSLPAIDERPCHFPRAECVERAVWATKTVDMSDPFRPFRRDDRDHHGAALPARRRLAPSMGAHAHRRRRQCHHRPNRTGPCHVPVRRVEWPPPRARSPPPRRDRPRPRRRAARSARRCRAAAP